MSMKRMISIFISVYIVLQGLCVFADSNDFYSLNIDGYVGEEAALTLSGDEKAAFDIYGTIQKKVFSTASEEKSYIDLANGAFAVDSEKIKNLDAISISMWFNFTDMHEKKIFSFENSNGKSDFSLSYDGNGKLIYVAGFRTEKYMITKKVEQLIGSDSWNNIVASRNRRNDGKWNYSLIYNGELICEGATSGIKTDQSDYKLYVGGKQGGAGYKLADLKIESGIKDILSAQVEYNANKSRYEELKDSISLADVLPSKGGEIDECINKLTLMFDNFVNPDTVKDGITFTTENGSPIPGGVYYRVDKKQVNLLFPNLQTGEKYILAVNGLLKSANGYEAEKQEYVFTAKRDYILDDDFSDDKYVVGEHPNEDGTIRYFSDGNWGSKNIEVCAADDGDKYLMLKSGVKDKDNFIDMTFDSPLENRVVISEMKLKTYNTLSDNNVITTPNSLIRMYCHENAISPFVICGESSEGKFVGNVTQPNMTYTTYVMSDNTRDANGFNDVRFVIKKNDSGKYCVSMSDMHDSEGDEFLKTIDPDSIDSSRIYGVAAVLLYPTGDDAENQIANDRYCLSSWKMYYAPQPKIIYSDADGMDPKSASFKIVFSDDVDVNSLKKGNIILRKKSDSRDIGLDIGEYNSKTNTLEVFPNEYLDYNEEYEVILSGVKSTLGAVSNESGYSFVTGKRSLYADTVIPAQNVNSVSFSTVVKNETNSKRNIVLAAVIYNSTGQAVGANTVAAEIYSGESLPMSVCIEKENIMPGYNAKLFSMEEFDGGLYSISDEPYAYVCK